MKHRLIAIGLLSIPSCMAAGCLAVDGSVADPAETDPASGLIIDDGWQLVRAHCGGCHSYRLVTSQRGNAAYWQDTIVWMQRTQNLWPIEAGQRATLIHYLARNYNETSWGRRPALAPRLLPAPTPSTVSAPSK